MVLYSNKAVQFKKLYPELIKRMDDAKDEIRIQTCVTWGHFFSAVNIWNTEMKPACEKYDPSGTMNSVLDEAGALLELRLDQSHFEAILKGLTLHLDDVNNTLQVSQCLFRKLSRIAWSSVRRKCLLPSWLEAISMKSKALTGPLYF